MKAKKLEMLKCSAFYLQDLQPGIGVLLKLFFFCFFVFFFWFFFGFLVFYKNNKKWIISKACRYVWRRAELVIPHWSSWSLAREADCHILNVKQKKVYKFINRTWMIEEELKSSLPQSWILNDFKFQINSSKRNWKVHSGRLDSAQALFCEIRNRKRYWLGTE